MNAFPPRPAQAPPHGLPRRTRRAQQRGVTAVETGLVFLILIAACTATIDLARWTLAFSGAQEAARLGARVAAVCDPGNSTAVDGARSRLIAVRSLARVPDVLVSLEPAGCGASSCSTVRVSVQGGSIEGISPWWTGPLPLPATTIEIPREALRSTLEGRSNPACL